MIVADYIAEALARDGVGYVFGVGGANIEDMFAAVQRRRPRLRAVLGKHEHAAGTAADGYARVSGGLGVVMATSGGGAMNLVHALAEARASRVPVLAIVGEPPSDVQGRGAFQDTSGLGGAVDAAQVFRAVSVFCARVETAGQVRQLFAAARDAACGPIPGPAVLLIAKDRQRAELPDAALVPARAAPAAASEGDGGALGRAAQLLDRDPVIVLAGDEIARAGAREALAAFVSALDARVAVAPDARDAFDNHAAGFLGVAGAMGHPAVARALVEAGVCVLAGTRLPLLARQGLEAALADKPLVCLGREPAFVAPPGSVHVGGDLRANLHRLLPMIRARVSAGQPTAQPSLPSPAGGELASSAVLAAVERTLPDGGVVVIDAGNAGAQAVHHLRAPRGGRWLIAMGMAGMGWSFGAAVGAALASGRRCTVLAGDGAFFMHGLDMHTAVEHALPITYVVFNNHAHGMCLVRERLLLGGESGYNAFRPAHIGAGLAAMFPGLAAYDCRTLDEVEDALARARTAVGPAVVCAELPAVEVPPFLAFQQAGGAR